MSGADDAILLPPPMPVAAVPAELADACPECGYDRRGLDLGRACPECGFAPDAAHPIVWGSTGIEKSGTGKAVIVGTIVGLLLVQVIPIAIILAPLYGCIAMVVAVAAIIGGWVYLFRQRKQRRADLPDEAQLRATPAGFGTRAGVGPVTLQPWKPNLEVRAKLMRDGWHVWIDELWRSTRMKRLLDFKPRGDYPEAKALADRLAGYIAQAGGDGESGA